MKIDYNNVSSFDKSTLVFLFVFFCFVFVFGFRFSRGGIIIIIIIIIIILSMGLQKRRRHRYKEGAQDPKSGCRVFESKSRRGDILLRSSYSSTLREYW